MLSRPNGVCIVYFAVDALNKRNETLYTFMHRHEALVFHTNIYMCLENGPY